MKIQLRDLSFAYPRPRSGEAAGPVLSNVSLDVLEGEFFTLLGPSGCGKTTLLWLLAGFLKPSAGEILFNDEIANDTPPEDRSIGIVFQNYALFPHMSVFENVAFGPKSRGESKAEIVQRVETSLAMVNLPQIATRRPAELSGGQQQRVALARAVAAKPRALLMDEPLSNLDAALRLETRRRVKELQREVGATTVYVTHDQEEAFALSDRLAVMNAGRLFQVGSPDELYQKPERPFVASFLGRCNLLPVAIRGEKITVPEVGEFPAPPRASTLPDNATEAFLLIRPEQLRLETKGEDSPPARLTGRLVFQEYLGERRVLSVESPALPDGRVEVALYGAEARREPAALGEEITLGFDPADCWLLPVSDDE
jgi:ABC-type Fe3+/spermidine/putrescine transport system ATPase subunit